MSNLKLFIREGVLGNYTYGKPFEGPERRSVDFKMDSENFDKSYELTTLWMVKEKIESLITGRKT